MDLSDLLQNFVAHFDRLPQFVQSLVPVACLLIVIAAVVHRLPRVDVGHSDDFRRRRFFNWFPLGLTYALLYMGRYNLTVSTNYLPNLTNEDFGDIFAAGTFTYAFAFIVNGPLTDVLGGRKTMLVSAAGAAIANLALGAIVLAGPRDGVVTWMAIVYAINMYFQSFGAVSIVKVNAAWFHVRERGTFGGIFGILISLGIFFAFDVGRILAEAFPTHYVFFVPAALLLAMVAVDFPLVRDTPGEAGLADFDPQDASSGDDGPRAPVFTVLRRMFSNPVIWVIALVEFCSGFLRNAVMQWYLKFAKQTGVDGEFVPQNWGVLLCIAGILGGMLAGVISDRVFGARRGPVATVLYGALGLGAVASFFLLGSAALGWVMIAMSLSVIGVHGMLSGTASMDFGGRRNVGVAVAIIDGFVYLGTGAQALLLGKLLPSGDAARDPSAWSAWPVAMMIASAVGLLIATRVWNARPVPRGPRDAAPRATQDGRPASGSDGQSAEIAPALAAISSTSDAAQT